MHRSLSAILLIMLLAAPLLAQEDLSRLEMGLGYGNIGFGELYNHRFSGINVYTDINLTNWFALSNFLGLYPGPDDTSLYFDMFGPKFTFRGLGRMMPYGTAGIGFGSSRSLFNDADLADLRAGGGVDIPVGRALILRFDVSRMWFKSNGFWSPGTNLSTGVVFDLN